MAQTLLFRNPERGARRNVERFARAVWLCARFIFPWILFSSVRISIRRGVFLPPHLHAGNHQLIQEARHLCQELGYVFGTTIASPKCLSNHSVVVSCLSLIRVSSTFSLVSLHSCRLSRAVSRSNWRRSKRSTPNFLKRCLRDSTTVRASSATTCSSEGEAHAAVLLFKLFRLHSLYPRGASTYHVG